MSGKSPPWIHRRGSSNARAAAKKSSCPVGQITCINTASQNSKPAPGNRPRAFSIGWLRIRGTRHRVRVLRAVRRSHSSHVGAAILSFSASRWAERNRDEKTAGCRIDRSVIHFVGGEGSRPRGRRRVGRGVGSGGAGTGRGGGRRVHRIYGRAFDRAFMGASAIFVALPGCFALRRSTYRAIRT
jgi:hypothetical protein